jgi:hypothetical protein
MRRHKPKRALNGQKPQGYLYENALLPPSQQKA